MRRRDFIALLGSAAAVLARSRRLNAQQPAAERAARIGYLAPARTDHVVQAFQNGLKDLGYTEGGNLIVDYRFADGRLETMDELAAAMARSAPDVIVAVGIVAAVPAKRATSSIPIVLAPAGDPIQTGLVPSLVVPGGNITGVSLYASELNQKRLEVLKEAVPRLRRVAVFSNTNNPRYLAYWRDTQAAGEQLGLELHPVMARGLASLEADFAAIKRQGFEAFSIPTDAEFDSGRERIIRLAAEHRLPGMYEHRAFVDAGGLMSYGPNIDRMSYRAAAYVDKILKGAKPAHLPIEQPTSFELVINLTTARALGLKLAASFLARADEVIE